LPKVRNFPTRRNTEQSMKTVTHVPGLKCYQRVRLQKPKPSKFLKPFRFKGLGDVLAPVPVYQSLQKSLKRVGASWV
jgi:hypothetical protein